MNYFLENKFGDIPRHYLKLAQLIGLWFDDKESYDIAVKIVEEAEESPRNIFAKIRKEVLIHGKFSSISKTLPHIYYLNHFITF